MEVPSSSTISFLRKSTNDHFKHFLGELLFFKIKLLLRGWGWEGRRGLNSVQRWIVNHTGCLEGQGWTSLIPRLSGISVIVDKSFSHWSHINAVCWSVFLELLEISNARPWLSVFQTKISCLLGCRPGWIIATVYLSISVTRTGQNRDLVWSSVGDKQTMPHPRAQSALSTQFLLLPLIIIARRIIIFDTIKEI